MSVVTEQHEDRALEPDPDRRALRRDIEGMRAIAVLLVVLFHAGLGVLPGGYVGVDVFFVISGFVITTSLLRGVGASHPLARFYARRVRRLLPAATLVLIVVVALSHLFVAPLNRGARGGEVVAAALFYANWHFASLAVDYWAMPIGASPLLHFWSLSVEEQFYFIWPALLFGGLILARRTNRSPKVVLAGFIGTAGAGSLACAILLTGDHNPWAFFGLHTRLWELAVGALLAIGASALAKLPGTLAGVLSVGGLIAIGYSAAVLSERTPFPGTAAMIPVFGTAAVLAAGVSQHSGPVQRLLGTRLLVYLGARSYAWYLWHWPAIVFAGLLATNGGQDVDKSALAGGAVAPPLAAAWAVLISLVAADLSYRFVENPIRHNATLVAHTARTLIVGLVLAALAVAAAGTLLRYNVVDQIPTASGADDVGSLPLIDQVRIIHDPSGNGYRAYGGCWASNESASPLKKPCVFGDLTSERSIAVIGDSHMAMWMPAIEKFGQTHHYKVRFWALDSCHVVGPGEGTCGRWLGDVTKELERVGPLDAVLVGQYSGTTADDIPAKPVVDGWIRAAYERLARSTDRIVFFRDGPIAPRDTAICVSTHLDIPSSCNFSASEVPTLDAAYADAEERVARTMGIRVRSISTVDLLCPLPDRVCPAVVENILSFGDKTHITPQRAEQLASPLAAVLSSVLD